jgi:uncharacterized protein YyaL (SSP411 family)
VNSDRDSGSNAHNSAAVNRSNKLIESRSPYLLQHAHNPVDWYPWGDEAFDKAKREDKAIFLSIGYSTCHWCHVMEHESFVDEHVAALMNNVFISIKVDREERPDVDNVYMSVCQMMTGGGGWPLSIIMTPDKLPFFAATYIPRDSGYGRLGMIDLVPRVGELWRNHREEALSAADRIVECLRKPAATASRVSDSGVSLLHSAFVELEDGFDDEFGGFIGKRKFPMPHSLVFLLRYWKRTGNDRALEMVNRTLTAMRCGGIYDHVGFGFHRYSTDPEWRLPHFEKMLYDQALLASAYLEAYQATRNEFYAETARQTLDYVLRDLTSEEGGFFSAEDADSEGEEGKFYVWTKKELADLLGADDAHLLAAVYEIREEGNFREESTGERTGMNVLHTALPIEQAAAQVGISEGDLHSRLTSSLRWLFEHRIKRVRPALDDKILTDWNGLMIAALSQGIRVLGDRKYADAASRAAEFLLSEMRTPHGRLLHRYHRGDAAVFGYLDDHAFLIHGLIELYQSVFETRFLKAAVELNATLMERFFDPATGAFFFSANDAEILIHRTMEFFDGAVPSGNSIQLLNLLRLARLTARREYEESARRLLDAFSDNVSTGALHHTQFLVGLDYAIGPTSEVVVVEGARSDGVVEMLGALCGTYAPSKVVLLKWALSDGGQLSSLAPFVDKLAPADGKTTAYVCSNHACSLPTTDPVEMLRLLTTRQLVE